jgi:hypothetical protein
MQFVHTRYVYLANKRRPGTTVGEAPLAGPHHQLARAALVVASQVVPPTVTQPQRLSLQGGISDGLEACS